LEKKFLNFDIKIQHGRDEKAANLSLIFHINTHGSL